jgi:hypothetical protein
MALSSRWYDRNLSKIELIAAVLLISIFIGVFAVRALKIFALAEQTSVTLTINNMNTALKYRAILAVANNRLDELEEMTQINPMQLVYTGSETYTKTREDMKDEIEQPPETTPSNYMGELYDPDINDIEPGNWYFDRGVNLLIYRVRNTEFFYSSLDGPERIRYAVKVEYEDINNNDQYDPAEDRFMNIKIESIDTYEWDI